MSYIIKRLGISKKLLMYLIYFSLFFVLLNSVNGIVNDCNLGSLSNDTIININDEYRCITGFNFTNLHNLTINCNGNFLNNYQKNMSFHDSDMTFIDCNFRFPEYIFDNAQTNISFYDSSFLNAGFNLTYIGGNYILYAHKVFYVRDKFTEIVPDAMIHIIDNDYPSNEVYGYKQLSDFSIDILMISKNFIAGVQNPPVNSYFYNSTINVSSILFGNSYYNDTYIYGANQNFILNDTLPPNVLSIVPYYNSLGINFTIKFDEKITGGIDIREMDDTVLTTVNVVNQTEVFISNFSLVEGINYKLNIIVNDSHDNFYIQPPTVYKFMILNTVTNSGDSFSYRGDPQTTTTFNFSSSVNSIDVEFLESVNLSNNLNLSSEIQISNNFIYINSSSRFNKIARLFFNNLPYQSTPVILKNGVPCFGVVCGVESYTSSNLIFNVTGFSNYTTVSNSVLNFVNIGDYVGKEILVGANFTRYNDSQYIDLNSSCNITITDFGEVPLVYNSTYGVYLINLTYNVMKNVSYNLSCVSLSYDDDNVSGILNLSYQVIDNFTAILDFVVKGGTSKVTNLKYFNVSVSSLGSNNTDGYYDTYYEFMVSKIITYPQTDWNTIYNLTSWIDIGNNEYFEIYNNGEEYTSYNFSNSSVGNFSSFVFIDKNGMNLYVTVRACVPGGLCKYFSDSTNNMIFEDITHPEVVFFDIDNISNSTTNLGFVFRVKDLESGILNISYSVSLNDSYIVPVENIPFLNNYLNSFNVSLHGTNIYNFIDGKSYKVNLNVINNVVPNPLSTFYSSSNFLIDVRTPINSTFIIDTNTSVLGGFLNFTDVTFNFSAGRDYDFNYSALGKESSGLDYMELFVSFASLSNGVCQIFGAYSVLNVTLNEINTTYDEVLTTGFCYKYAYYVYDKAGNINVVYLNKTLKVDVTAPVVNLIDSAFEILDYTDESPLNAENINKNYFALDNNSVLFKARWDIVDSESIVSYYSLELIDNNTGVVVLNYTNYTSSEFSVYYDESYIKDNTNYKVRVSAFNNAGTQSEVVMTNGAMVFIAKVPKITYDTIYYVDSEEVLVDFDESDNLSVFDFKDETGFNLTCRVYENDVGYDNLTGSVCLSNTSRVTCSFNTTVGINNFSISCKSDESIKFSRTYNDATDNLDVSISVGNNSHINMSEIYIDPKINVSYYNLNSNFTLYNNKNLLINLSNYFYEENTQYGFPDNLSYVYSNLNNLNVLSLNSSSAVIDLIGVDNFKGSGFMDIKVVNLVGGFSNYTRFYFNISRYNVSISIVLNSPVDSFVNLRENRYLNISVGSNVTLSNVNMNVNNVDYLLCDSQSSCLTTFVDLNYYVPNMVEGVNNFSFKVVDLYGNYNESSVMNFNFSFDTDLDGVSDLLESDIDNDGVNDTQDSIVGLNTSIYSNLFNFSLKINDSTDLSVQYGDVYNVSFSNSNYSIVDFVYNFTNSSLDLQGVSIVFDNSSLRSSIVVRGFNFTGGITKSVVLKKSSNLNYSDVCVKDSEVVDISEMSVGCDLDDEFVVSCPGSYLGYSCIATVTDFGDAWKITGLYHSAVKITCSENWQYSAWSSCVASVHTRTANDLNGCGTVNVRDVLSESCVLPSSNGGGSSSGGGSSGGGSGYISIPVVEENNTVNEEIIEVEVDDEIIFIGDFDLNSFSSKVINEDDKYSFKFYGEMIVGYFKFNDNGVSFKSITSNFGFDVGFGINVVDINGDSKNDMNFTLVESGSSFLLQGSKVEVLKVEKIVGDEIDETDSFSGVSYVVEEDENLMFTIGLGLLVAVLFIIIAVVIFVKKNNRKGKVFDNKVIKSVEKSYGKNEREIKSLNRVNDSDNDKRLDFDKRLDNIFNSDKDLNSDEFVDKVLNISDKFKEFVILEGDIIEKMRFNVISKVQEGYSWVDIYMYLKKKGISEKIIRKFIDFRYLVDKFENFYLVNDVSSMSKENLKSLLLGQNWFGECYIYDGDGRDILRDILFLFSGSNIYGFSKDKFLNLLEKEFSYGLTVFDVSNVNFLSIKLDENKIIELINLQNEYTNLMSSVVSLKEVFSKVDLTSQDEEDMLDIISRIVIDLESRL